MLYLTIEMRGEYKLNNLEKGEYVFMPRLKEKEAFIDIQNTYGASIKKSGDSYYKGIGGLDNLLPSQPPKYLYCDISHRNTDGVRDIAYIKANMTAFHEKFKVNIPNKNQDSDFIFTSDHHYNDEQSPVNCFSINIFQYGKNFDEGIVATKYTKPVFDLYNQVAIAQTGYNISEIYEGYAPLYRGFGWGDKEYYETPAALDSYHNFLDFEKISAIYQEYKKGVEFLDRLNLSEVEQLPKMLVCEVYFADHGSDEL